ncbi:MAG TPA: hypothetical protein VJ921_04495, partial [Vicinamibacteria bacterium]|nr:hypothetical protein [Vicinamibacteria bacterium]
AAAALDALALLAAAILWNVPGADWYGLFFCASILVAILFAALGAETDLEALARLHLGASLGIAAAGSSDPAWVVPAVLLFGALVQPTWKRIPLFLVPGIAALLGLLPGAGGAPILLGLSAMWLVAVREVLRSSKASLVTRMAISFTLLAAVCSVALRLPTGPLLHALALAGLGLGAVGVVGSTRVTTFLTSMALARAGLVLFAQLGGAPGRTPALLALAVTGVSLLLLAAALENTETVEEISTLRSVPRRLVLVLGALSLGSFPPFPGFFVLFPLSSAVLERGYVASLVAASGLLFLTALGALRLASRAFPSEGARTNEMGIGRAVLVLSLAAVLLFSIAPAPLVELARAAALVLN